MWMQILMKLLGGVGAALQGSKPARSQPTWMSTDPNDAYASKTEVAKQPEVAPSDGGFLSALGSTAGKAAGAIGRGGGASSMGTSGGVAGGFGGGANGGGWLDKLGGMLGGVLGVAQPAQASAGDRYMAGIPDSMRNVAEGSAANLPRSTPPTGAAGAVPVAPITTATPGSGGWMDTLKAWGGKAVDLAGQAQDTYHDAVLGPGAESLTPDQRRRAIWRSRLMGAGTALQGGGPGQVMAARGLAGANAVNTYRSIAKDEAPRPFKAPVNREVVVGNDSVQRQIWDSETGSYVDDGKPYARFKPEAEKGGGRALTLSQERGNAAQLEDFNWLLEQPQKELARLLGGGLDITTLDGTRVRSALKPMIGESPAEFTARKAKLRRAAGMKDSTEAAAAAAPTDSAPSRWFSPDGFGELGRAASGAYDAGKEFLFPNRSVDPAEEERVKRLAERWQ